MTIKIQLPSDKKEALFVIELLKKLNLIFEPQEEVLSDELKKRLSERIADMNEHPDDVISWEDIQKRDNLQTTTV